MHLCSPILAPWVTPLPLLYFNVFALQREVWGAGQGKDFLDHPEIWRAVVLTSWLLPRSSQCHGCHSSASRASTREQCPYCKVTPDTHEEHTFSLSYLSKVLSYPPLRVPSALGNHWKNHPTLKFIRSKNAQVGPSQNFEAENQDV